MLEGLKKILSDRIASLNPIPRNYCERGVHNGDARRNTF
jgi:hypothetical protein